MGLTPIIDEDGHPTLGPAGHTSSTSPRSNPSPSRPTSSSPRTIRTTLPPRPNTRTTSTATFRRLPPSRSPVTYWHPTSNASLDVDRGISLRQPRHAGSRDLGGFARRRARELRARAPLSARLLAGPAHLGLDDSMDTTHADAALRPPPQAYRARFGEVAEDRAALRAQVRCGSHGTVAQGRSGRLAAMLRVRRGGAVAQAREWSFERTSGRRTRKRWRRALAAGKFERMFAAADGWHRDDTGMARGFG